VTAATVPALPLVAVAGALVAAVGVAAVVCVVRVVVGPLEVELEPDPHAATDRLMTRVATTGFGGHIAL
jgi:hypothetical protein